MYINTKENSEIPELGHSLHFNKEGWRLEFHSPSAICYSFHVTLHEQSMEFPSFGGSDIHACSPFEWEVTKSV